MKCTRLETFHDSGGNFRVTVEVERCEHEGSHRSSTPSRARRVLQTLPPLQRSAFVPSSPNPEQVDEKKDDERPSGTRADSEEKKKSALHERLKAATYLKGKIVNVNRKLDLVSGNVKIGERIVKDWTTLEALAEMVLVVAERKHIPNEQVLQRFLTAVPQIAVDGDNHITLQNGDKCDYSKGLSKHGTFPNMVHHQKLLNYDERRKARRKVIIGPSYVYAFGGYPESNPLQYYLDPVKVVLVNFAAPSFETVNLEFNEILLNPRRILVPDDLKNNIIVPLGETGSFDYSALQTLFKDDFLLVFRSIHKYAESNGHENMFVKVPAIGAGFFANTPFKDGKGNNISMASFIIPIIPAMITECVEQHPELFSRIMAIELPDFTEEGTFKFEPDQKDMINKKLGENFKFVEKGARDILNFDSKEREEYDALVVVNAGDAFCIPGNEFARTSVEGEIGENTAIRVTHSWRYNKRVLDPKHHWFVEEDGTMK